uniref:tetratricopeptide repeat protein n=1 Tax=Flavobacterium sp. TaxID=239 RepID=UPI00404B5051
MYKLFFCFFTFLFLQLTMANDFDKATQLFNENKIEQAQILFENYLKSNPNHTKTMEYLGDIAGVKKDWDLAISYYRKIKNQMPSNANYHYKYGGVLGMQAKEANKFKALGMLDEVEESFLNAIKLDKNHVDARMALVILYMELPGIIGGSERKALKYADEIALISKADGYLAKGTIDEYNNNYRQAEKKYLLAFQMDKKSLKSYQKLYDLYVVKLKDANKASELKKQFYN